MTFASANQLSCVRDVEQLKQLLSEPTELLVDTMRKLSGDIMILGAGGKMGPTLARMAKRASDLAGVARRVIGVSRFSSDGLQQELSDHGVETIGADLLDDAQLRRLPDVDNVVFMAGRKFGSHGAEGLTWAMNVFLPGMVARRFHHSRIAAFSTGNVYGLTPISTGGSKETDSLRPLGEYAMSCVGRERVFDHFSRTFDTPITILRLNYAVEMRYGVLADLAQKISGGHSVDLSMGHYNVIWQADANAMALCALQHASSPPLVVNVCGPELLSVRETCERLAHLLKTNVAFTGTESRDALISNGERGFQLFGRPRVDSERILGWTADWIRRGLPTLDKPTRFDVRDGSY